MSPTPNPAAADAPIEEFSHCHEGIVAQLNELARLPELAQAAQRARRVAQATEAFFREVVLVHHREEEEELFPAVLQSARAGEERDQVKVQVERLTQDHRDIEKAWRELVPGVHAVAYGHGVNLDPARVADFVARYRGHAEQEEAVFLPLSSRILGREGSHVAALGLSLHARHALPEVLRRYDVHL